MVLARIEAILKDKMGLDAVSIGTASVERAVRQRMETLRLQDEPQYLERLLGSESELQELIEEVVVGETWFFRDKEAFTVLTRHAQEETLRRPAEHVFRVLSLPCSTGEEPYSMAIALLEAGIPAQRFQIDAVDISARAVAYAERGLYGKNSFRGQDLAFRDRHFEPDGQRHSVKDSIRRQVRFSHGNMLAAGWLPGAHTYDAIFCRNVLIYFDRPTQERALQVLSRLLLPTGIICVGPSETALLMDHSFVSVPQARAFAFHKPQAQAPQSKPHPQRRPAPANPLRAPAPVQNKPLKAPAARPAPAPAAPAVRPGLEEAQRLANEGKLTEALRSCEQYLRETPTSAEGFYLMGLLHDAAQQPEEAARHYRKAVYLDPAHQEALVHLAVVLEKTGDAAGARRLFERARRGGAKA